MRSSDDIREVRAITSKPVELEASIEVPRGSFVKRDSIGRVTFISPLPCPFNYGSIPEYIGLDGDLLDAVVLGPRMPFGTRIRVKAWGAVTLIDRGMKDHKLICSRTSLSRTQRSFVLRFFHFYARCKRLLNVLRRRPGRTACEGWCEVTDALACALPSDNAWRGPRIPF